MSRPDRPKGEYRSAQREGTPVSVIVKNEFAVAGMHCGGCVKSVTHAVSQLAGVQTVEVSLEKNGATVEYDGTATGPAAIVAAIEAAGFEARPR